MDEPDQEREDKLRRRARCAIREAASGPKSGGLVVFAGEGVAFDASGRHPHATWAGLIAAGLQAVERLDERRQARWVARKRRDLADTLEPDERADLADQLCKRLGDRPHGAMAGWLAETVGALPMERPALPAALGALTPHLVCLTCDGLLSEATGRPALNAGVKGDRHKLGAWLRGERAGILHLSGHHDAPHSVSLGSGHFALLQADEHDKALLQALRMTHTAVFVGCDDPLVDPRLTALLAWARQTLKHDTREHFIVTTSDRVEDLREQVDLDDRLLVVDAGPTMADVTRFLQGCLPAGSEAPAPLAAARAQAPMTPDELRAAVLDEASRMPWLQGAMEGDARPDQRGRWALTDVVVTVRVHSEAERERQPERQPEALPLWEALSRGPRRHVLVGDPGSGKSTLLRQLVHRVCCPAEPGEPQDPRLPVLLHVQKVVDHATLREAVEQVYSPRAWSVVAAAEARGELLLLLDGLDEATARHGDGGAVRESVLRLARAHPTAHLVVASRREARPEALDFSWLDVEALGRDAAAELLGKLGLPDGLDPERVVDDLRSDDRRELAESPLLLTLVAGILRADARADRVPELPRGRAALYDVAVERMLSRTFAPDPEAAAPIRRPDLCRDALEHLCGSLHSHPSDPWPHRLVRRALRSNPALAAELRAVWGSERAFLDDQAHRVGLLVPGDPSAGAAWHAPHRTLREYLAACGMACHWADAEWSAEPPPSLRAVLDAVAPDSGDTDARSRVVELLALFVGVVAERRPACTARAFSWLLNRGEAHPESADVAWRALRDVRRLSVADAVRLWRLRREHRRDRRRGYARREDDAFTLINHLPALLPSAQGRLDALRQMLDDAVARWSQRQGEVADAEVYFAWRGVRDLADAPDAPATLRAEAAALAEGLFERLDPTDFAARCDRARALLRGGLLDGTPLQGDATGPWRPIPPGTFWMGAPEGESTWDHETPAHRVRILGEGDAAFHALAVPATWALYACFDPAGGERRRRWSRDGDDVPPEAQDAHPAYNLSWYEAALCAAWVATLDPAWAGCRLPTETEWEYLCRGVTDAEADPRTRYWSGDDDDALDRAGWFPNNSGRRTHAVGQKAKNPFDLFDVHGNVWEWCRDPWDAQRYARRASALPADGHHPHDPAATPAAAPPSARRVIRGGSWAFVADFCRSACRDWRPPTDRDRDRGFRLVLAPLPGRGR